VNGRTVALAVAAFGAVLAPASSSQAASSFSYAFATPPVVTAAGQFTSAITAFTSVAGPLSVVVTAQSGTIITSTDDPACTLTATGEECATTVTAYGTTNLAFAGTYSGSLIDLQISATDANGPVTYAGNTLYPAPPVDVVDPPVTTSPPPTTLPLPPMSPVAATESQRSRTGAGLLHHRRTRILALTNGQRTAAGLHPLTINPDLTRSAQQYVEHLAADGAFSHTDGSVLAGRVAATGYRYQVVGENLALGQTTPRSVVAAWMASPDHRANMLDAHFTQMGVGVAKRSDGRVVWCIDFGWPQS
jgi:uncharacterized protein YkwD